MRKLRASLARIGICTAHMTDAEFEAALLHLVACLGEAARKSGVSVAEAKSSLVNLGRAMNTMNTVKP
jgi:hypothetical protein